MIQAWDAFVLMLKVSGGPCALTVYLNGASSFGSSSKVDMALEYTEVETVMRGGGGGGGGTVIPYPCKSGGIYSLSLKVPRLLSLKVLPF